VAALAKAGCADRGATISGLSIPFSLRARSRAVLTAIRMLSVPPDVMAPPASSPAWSRFAVIATTSTSISRRLGKRNGLSAFSNM
jgi:hypothetical protein